MIIHYKSSSDPAEELAAQLPSAEIVQCDVSEPQAAKQMVETLARRIGDWRCIINSASVFDYDDAASLDTETFDNSMAVNALSPALISQTYFAKAQSSALRCVIQITDMKLENSNPDFFSYTMSKHALAATIPMLAKGASGESNRVYGIAPGAILASHDQNEKETDISHLLNLLKRKTDASEIVDAALFLTSGSLKSGSTLYIDSGQHLLDQPRDVIYLAREQAT